MTYLQYFSSKAWRSDQIYIYKGDLFLLMTLSPNLTYFMCISLRKWSYSFHQFWNFWPISAIIGLSSPNFYQQIAEKQFFRSFYQVDKFQQSFNSYSVTLHLLCSTKNAHTLNLSLLLDNSSIFSNAHFYKQSRFQTPNSLNPRTQNKNSTGQERSYLWVICSKNSFQTLIGSSDTSFL